MMASVTIPKELEQAQIVCVIGGPCVGKGTHCTKLANDLSVTHVSVGDLLRVEADKPDAKYRSIILNNMSAGELVPKDIVQEVLVDYLVQAMKQGKTCFLVDGFPRSMAQAKAFEKSGWKVKGVLHFHSSEEIMRKRMLGRAGAENRIDDTVKIHKKRLEDFIKQSPPVISFYETEGLYFKVDCEGDFEEVYQGLPALVESIFDFLGTAARAA